MKRFLLSIGLLAVIFTVGHFFQNWNEKATNTHDAQSVPSSGCDTLNVQNNDSCNHTTSYNQTTDNTVCV